MIASICKIGIKQTTFSDAVSYWRFMGYLRSSQSRSHLFLVGAAEIERRRREGECRRREAILGGHPPRKFFKQTVRFRAF